MKIELNRNDEISLKINMKLEGYRQNENFNCSQISDGHHTFGELYKHRIHLFIALCHHLNNKYKIIKSKKHFDGSEFEGWFIIQLETSQGQISYHLPNEYLDKCDFIQTVEKANEWDGHTSDDVLERLLLI